MYIRISDLVQHGVGGREVVKSSKRVMNWGEKGEFFIQGVLQSPYVYETEGLNHVVKASVLV